MLNAVNGHTGIFLVVSNTPTVTGREGRGMLSTRVAMMGEEMLEGVINVELG